LLFLWARRGGHLAGKIDGRPAMQIALCFTHRYRYILRYSYLYGFLAHDWYLEDGFNDKTLHLRYLLGGVLWRRPIVA
jgi:hypothetical protein